ncbi:MAG: peptidase [Azospirillum sp.]|nr:peptidase [Azospirillum sp.]
MTGTLSLSLLFAVIFGGAMVVAMTWDAACFEIPDTVSIVLVAAALVAMVSSTAIPVIFSHLGVGLGVFAVGVGLFAARLWGGGDVKFMAATCLWLAPGDLPGYFLAVSLAGGVLAAAIVVFRRVAIPQTWHNLHWVQRLRDPAEGIPYGVALGIGGLVSAEAALKGVGYLS